MLIIQCSAEVDEDPSGFENGDIVLLGEGGEARFNCMVVLSAAGLLDNVRVWMENSLSWALDFGPLDCTRGFSLQKKGEDIVVLVPGKNEARIIGRASRREFLLEVHRACVALASELVDRLPPGDAGRHDFNLSLAEFEVFMKRAADRSGR
jgi:hypothetical protein